MSSPKPKIVQRTLADGSVKTYVYERKSTSEPAAVTVGTVRREYELSTEFRALAAETKRSYRRTLDLICTEYEAVPVALIKRRHVKGSANAHADRPGLVHLLLKVWARLLSWAVEEEYIEFNPARDIARPRLGEHRRWSDEQIAYVLEHAAEHHRRAVILGLYTGQRVSDLVRMTWHDYDGVGVNVTPLKTQHSTGVQLYIPAHPVLKAALDEWRAEGRSVTILTHAQGSPWASATSLSTTFRDWAKKHPALDGCVLHGLRKCVAATLAEAGCTTKQIQAITGHATLGEIERYTRQADQRTQATAAVVLWQGRK